MALQEVLVLNAGKKYNSPPDLTITGDGIGAVITPVMSNGTITSVKVLEPGTGYDQTTTSIGVVFPGRGVTLRAKLQIGESIYSRRISLISKMMMVLL